MNPRSVLLVTPRWTRDGGVAAHVVASATALAREGFDVHVLAARLELENPIAGVTLHHGPRLYDLDAPPATRVGEADSLAPDIVHMHQFEDPDVLAYLRGRAPVIISAHGYSACTAGVHHFRPGQECHRAHGPACFPNLLLRGCAHGRNPASLPPTYRRATRKLSALRAADLAISYSSAVDRHLAENRVSARAIVPLFPTVTPAAAGGAGGAPGAGDMAEAASVAGAGGGREDGAGGDSRPGERGNAGGRPGRRVLFAGRVVKPKGIDVLIRAAPAIDAELVVCGDGRRLDAARGLARELGVAERVRFTGWLSPEDLAREMGEASILAMPSLWPEPAGLVGLEAHAAGRPVVASATGGVLDWLEDEVNGLLVAPGDAGALSRALQQLLDDPARQDAMGQAGRRIVEERFTPQRHVAALEDAYAAARANWSAA
jgi:glycosyltransferase involved in cell wall biosynthesis